jgi:hypothetical protein
MQNISYLSVNPAPLNLSKITGLWLAVPELLAGNMAQVLGILQTGLQSEEHNKFVQKLTN